MSSMLISELQDFFITLHCSSAETAASGELVEEAMPSEDVVYGIPHLVG